MKVDLLHTALLLARAGSKRPRQADLKRAISTAYYALFDAIASDAANQLAGRGSDRDYGIWRLTYRSLDHATAKKLCSQLRRLGFPDTLCKCGEAFVELQDGRHSADYDPYHRVTRTEAVGAIQLAEKAIENLMASKKADRHAFAIHLLLKRR